MAVQSLSFDIFANDRASATFKRLGLAASDASGDVRTLGDRLDKLGTRVTTARLKLDGNKEASAELDKLDVKLIRLGNRVADPNITVEGKIKALADIAAVDVAMDRLNKKFARPNVLARGLTSAGGAAAFAPSALGIAAGLSPALIPLAAGVAAGIGAITVSFGAATIGAGLFGLAAKSVLASASTNLTKLQALELRLNTATTAATKKSAQAAIDALKATFAPGYMKLLDDLEKFKAAWTKTSQTIAVPALTSWLTALTKAMPLLVTAVKPVADVFKNFGDIIRVDLADPAIMKNLQGMAAAFGKFSAGQLNLVGRAIGDMALGVYHLGKDFAGSGANFASAGVWFANMGTAFLNWSKSAKARNDVQGFMKFLHDEGPVVKSILTDLKNVLPGIFAGATTAGQLELQALSSFLGLVAGLPKGWQKPLTEAAGAMLLLSKTGVVRVGLKLTGKLAEHPAAFGFGIGTLLAGGIIDAVNQHKPGEKSLWQRFSPPPKGQAQTWLNSWAGLGDRIVQLADDTRHGVAFAWDHLWNNTTATTKQGNHDVAVLFDRFRHDVAAAWDRIWHASVTIVQNGVGNVVGWFQKLPGRALAALRGLGHSLYAFAHAALTEFLNGLKAIGGSILSWLGGLWHNIIGAAKKVLGVFSPSRVFYNIGKNLMAGLFHGIKDHAHQAIAAAQGVAHQVGNAGAGVQRWAPLVRRALAMEGLSPMLAGNVLYQMQTESGGNPNAINLTDSNAAMGDPSRGLMQTIMSTFQAYHWPGTSWNIYDPLANIAAALNYARHRYGPTLMSGGMGIGSGHGYDQGGWLPTGVTLAVNNTGRPERVLAPGQGALVNVETMVVQDATDAALVAQRLSFAMVAAGLS